MSQAPGFIYSYLIPAGSYPVTVKVSNAFLPEDLKIPRDVKKTPPHPHTRLLASAVPGGAPRQGPTPDLDLPLHFPQTPGGPCAYSSVRSPELDNPTTTLEFISC